MFIKVGAKFFNYCNACNRYMSVFCAGTKSASIKENRYFLMGI